MDNSNCESAAFKDNKTVKIRTAASCRACGTHINFKRLENGKSLVVEDDSRVHRCNEWYNWRADQG